MEKIKINVTKELEKVEKLRTIRKYLDNERTSIKELLKLYNELIDDVDSHIENKLNELLEEVNK